MGISEKLERYRQQGHLVTVTLIKGWYSEDFRGRLAIASNGNWAVIQTGWVELFKESQVADIQLVS